MQARCTGEKVSTLPLPIPGMARQSASAADALEAP